MYYTYILVFQRDNMVLVGVATTSARRRRSPWDANIECWCCWQDTKTCNIISKNTKPTNMKWSLSVGRRWVLAECVIREMHVGVVGNTQEHVTWFSKIQVQRVWNDRSQWVDDECSQNTFPGRCKYRVLVLLARRKDTSRGFQKYKSSEYEMIVVGGPTTSSRKMCCLRDTNTECLWCWQNTEICNMVFKNTTTASRKWS